MCIRDSSSGFTNGTLNDSTARNARTWRTKNIRKNKRQGKIKKYV